VRSEVKFIVFFGVEFHMGDVMACIYEMDKKSF